MYLTCSRRSRILSTPVFDAPSISSTSIDAPAVTSRHESHAPHGVGVGAGKAMQFSALAMIRAVVVLPTPRGPENRYACARRLDVIAFDSVRVTNAITSKIGR